MDVIVKWVYRSWSMGFATATNICSWERGEKMVYARDISEEITKIIR